jgi:uncharacterized protein involved in exopolysaccharide biosynthesis/Mrp family chromosome partitioning ATPase
MLERNPNLVRPDQRQNHQAAIADDGGMSHRELMAFARRHFLTIVACMGLGVVLAGLYVASKEPTFTAYTQILIDLKAPTLLDTQGREVETSLDTAEVESQMTVLRSEMIATMVIEELGLVDDPEFRGQKTSWREMLVTTAADLALSTGLFEPEMVADWRASMIEATAGEEAAEGEIVVPGADAAPPEAEAATIGADAAAPPDGDAEGDPDLAAENARRVTLAIFQSRLGVNRISVSYVIEISFSSRDREKAARIANATADAYVREQLLSKIAAMEQGNEWLEARLNELRRKLNAATQAVQAFRARHDYSIPDAVPSETAAITGEAAGDESAVDESEAPTLEELEATADTYRKLYGSVLEAFTSSMQHKSYPYSLVRVITPASPPFDKSSPRTKITLVFGVLAGTLLGVGIAIARQGLDGSIRAARQVRSDLGTDCLVEVPRVRFWASDQRGLCNVCINPRSPFADAIGRLKTAIRINAKADGSVAIGITSALRGEGKSVIASNLGLACVGAGYRTLVVDGDPLRSTLSKSLRLPPEADASEGPARPDLGPGWPVQGDSWFDLLPARFGQNPGEWARTSAFAGSWRDFQPTNEMVIVDLPPIEQAIDVLPALPPLDFLVVVAEWGSTSIDAVAEAIRIADAFGTPLLGVVLTKVRRGGQRRRSIADRMGGHPIR